MKAMDERNDHLLVLCTCPDEACARNLAALLVKERLAACVNLLPGITSVYQWEGELETAVEWQMLIKTRAERFETLKVRLSDEHPYEIPEIIGLPITHGLPDYLNWINETTSEPLK